MLPTPFRSAATTLAALFVLTLTACAADATGPDDAIDGPGDGPSDGNVPAEIVGTWRYGSVSATNFWDDHTGMYAGNAYGMSDQYVFAANGTFTEHVYIYTQSYGCRIQAWVETSGGVTFDGESFTTQITSGRFKTIDTCASSNNKDRAMTAAERTERSKQTSYSLRSDAGKPFLRILDGRYDRAE